MFIAVAAHIFQIFVWEWFGSVHDFYVLQISSANNRFDRFSTSEILDAIKDSDEREDPDSWKIAKNPRDVFDGMS